METKAFKNKDEQTSFFLISVLLSAETMATAQQVHEAVLIVSHRKFWHILFQLKILCAQGENNLGLITSFVFESANRML